MPRRTNTINDVFKHINMHGGNKDVCWEWKLAFNAKDQRPYYTVDGKRKPAYAIALEAYKGAKTKRQVAMHSCDNGTAPVGCCNPYHLSWGTHIQNMNDMKDRERHGLPTTVVRAIKVLLIEGVTHSIIAARYGISRETVTAINTGRTHTSKD